jgi:hypothetical protein
MTTCPAESRIEFGMGMQLCSTKAFELQQPNGFAPVAVLLYENAP